jgi:hypothetical protein
MGRIVMKEAPNIDFYVVWSSVVEAPVAWGSREQMMSLIGHGSEERLARCDEIGTSSVWVQQAPWLGGPEWGAWEDGVYIFMQQGVLTREGVFEVARRMSRDEGSFDDLLQPFDDE